MRILVTGASGFIGSHIVRALNAAGHTVIAGVRNPDRSERLNPGTPCIACDFTRDSAVDWLPQLKGVDVVINAVGIITQTSRSRFDAVHVTGTKALFDACRQAGVGQIIHISALGVGPQGATAYNHTKLAADEYLLSLKVPAVVLRPAWLYGEGSDSFDVLCAFSALPAIPVTGRGDYQIQPIDITDFAAAVTRCVGNHTFDRQVVEVGGPEKIAIKDVHAKLRSWLALGPAATMHVPVGCVKWCVKLGDVVFKGPINSASFDMLTRNNVTDDMRLWERTAIKPHAFLKGPSKQASTNAQKSYAGLFFLLPLLRLSLAFLWLASAIIPAFLTPPRESLSLLFEAGLSGLHADMWLLYGAAMVDFILGLTLLFNWRLRTFGKIQIALILFYTLFIGLGAPHWWLHPYGPLIKNIPLLAATLVVIEAAGR